MAKWSAPRGTEQRYAAQLRKVAAQCQKIVDRFMVRGEVRDVQGMVTALSRYAATLTPWAKDLAARVIDEVQQGNMRAWTERSQAISKTLRGSVAQSAVGKAAQQLHTEQVTLITSLPLDAAMRAQKYAQEAMAGGARASYAAKLIAKTGEVTASRAMLIARTETAKANATLTQARAEAVGITHYIWRTMQDGDVRDSHAHMEGKVCRFDDPPDVDEGGAYNPGNIYNCRCFAEPLITKPDAPLELVAPGTSLIERAAEVAGEVASLRAAAKATAAATKMAATRASAAAPVKRAAKAATGEAKALRAAAKQTAAAAEKSAAEGALQALRRRSV